MPNSVLDTESCDDNDDGTVGERYIPPPSTSRSRTSLPAARPSSTARSPTRRRAEPAATTWGRWSPLRWQCEDGFDNDADGLIDAADPQCTGPGDDDERADPPARGGRSPAAVRTRTERARGPVDGSAPASVYSIAMKSFLRYLTLGVVCSGLAFWLRLRLGDPTAPSGTILTITANPSQISLNGSSQITVIGRRPDGNPLNSGVEIFFSTSQGSISPAVTTVNEDGLAFATLRGDGRAGTANVTASVSTTTGGGGGGEDGEGSGGPTTGVGSVSTSVLIGNDPEDRPTLIVTVSPNTLFVTETGEVTVIARNSDGSPVLAGTPVVLTTNLGSIQPNNPRVGSSGVATATFNAGDQQGTATVTAVVGSSEPVTTMVTIQDQPTEMVLSTNQTQIGTDDTDINLTAVVTNAQAEGLSQRPVTFTVDPAVGNFEPSCSDLDHHSRNRDDDSQSGWGAHVDRPEDHHYGDHTVGFRTDQERSRRRGHQLQQLQLKN